MKGLKGFLIGCSVMLNISLVFCIWVNYAMQKLIKETKYSVRTRYF